MFSTPFYSDFGMNEGGTALSGKCNDMHFKSLNDTLFELKAMAAVEVALYDNSFITEVPMYHYMYLENNKLQEKATGRLFAFTKYVKMDDSYVNGCYMYNDKRISQLTPAMLKYMKNEIYADYHYQFKDTTWTKVFEERFYSEKKNASVDDSLTAIDKYNINWINQKLKMQSASKIAAR